MVRESRAVADLLLSNADEGQWHQAIIIDNRLQKNRPATAKRAGQAIRKRLEKLEPPFWQALRDGDDQLRAWLELEKSRPILGDLVAPGRAGLWTDDALRREQPVPPRRPDPGEPVPTWLSPLHSGREH